MSSPPLLIDRLPPLKVSHLAWFEGEDAADGVGLGCNRDYRDLRGLTVEDFRLVIDRETRELDRVAMNRLRCAGCEDGCDECEVEIDGLELGVASVVVALSVIGCIPYTSCNGGLLGGAHAAEVCIVGFYMRPAHVSQVKAAAGQARVGLTNDRCGGFYVLADDPRAMMAFAVALSGLAD